MLDDIKKQKIEIGIEQMEADISEFAESFSPGKRYLIYTLLALAIPGLFFSRFVTIQVYAAKFRQRQISAHRAFVSSKPVQILSAKILPILGSSYSAYALIRNPNPNLSSPNLLYTFYFIDSSGIRIASVQGQTFLFPGAVKYLIVPNVKLNRSPKLVRINIYNQIWQRRLDLPNIILRSDTPRQSNVQNPDGYKIDGNFINDSVFTIGSVQASAIVRDSGNHIIAVTQSVENTVTPHELRAYHMYWPVPIGASPLRVQIQLETNVFNLNNITNPSIPNPALPR